MPFGLFTTERDKTEAFDDGFDAALNEMGPMLDEWDRLSNDERGQIKSIAPLFVEKLERFKVEADRT